MSARTESMPVIEEMSFEQGRAMLAPLVQDRLGITLDEFVSRYDDGDFREDDDQTLGLVMMLPFVR